MRPRSFHRARAERRRSGPAGSRAPGWGRAARKFELRTHGAELRLAGEGAPRYIPEGLDPRLDRQATTAARPTARTFRPAGTASGPPPRTTMASGTRRALRSRSSCSRAFHQTRAFRELSKKCSAAHALSGMDRFHRLRVAKDGGPLRRRQRRPSATRAMARELHDSLARGLAAGSPSTRARSASRSRRRDRGERTGTRARSSRLVQSSLAGSWAWARCGTCSPNPCARGPARAALASMARELTADTTMGRPCSR